MVRIKAVDILRAKPKKSNHLSVKINSVIDCENFDNETNCPVRIERVVFVSDAFMCDNI